MSAFKDKLAVITGGASGIGRSLAFALGKEQARVLIADVDDGGLATTEAALKEAGIEAHSSRCDVTQQQDLDALAKLAFDDLGGAHLVFANAGIGAGEAGPMWGFAQSDWQWAFEVNFWGVVRTVNAFMPRLVAQAEPAHFTITGSGNGAFLVFSGQPIYTATKAAVQVVTEALYQQMLMEESPIQVHALLPGPHVVETGLFDSDRVRPERFAKAADAPDSGIHSVDDMRQQMKAYGQELKTIHPDQVAQIALQGIKDGKFWVTEWNQGTLAQVKARQESIVNLANPPLPSLG